MTNPHQTRVVVTRFLIVAQLGTTVALNNGIASPQWPCMSMQRHYYTPQSHLLMPQCHIILPTCHILVMQWDHHTMQWGRIATQSV